jgi:hypothetical protein
MANCDPYIHKQDFFIAWVNHEKQCFKQQDNQVCANIAVCGAVNKSTRIHSPDIFCSIQDKYLNIFSSE